ncbi:hypothetical protein PIB30_014340 [Stylosanthes scabra]|uniref:Uncharacterized protein n=1 Tax=Stylosanthes scabra TaxID=79078 RepID=A0ABU6R6E2_9FABA|nr:hypothetical protein [Stylosanthes scabra]
MALLNTMLLDSSSSSFIIISNSNKHTKAVEPLISNHRIINGGFQIRCVATTTTVVAQRKSANYQPNLWSYDFLQSLKHDYSDLIYEDLNRNLKEEVRRMIIRQKRDSNGEEMWHKLDLIDDVKRLGLSYQFEKDIEETLDRFVSTSTISGNFVNTKSLHQAALSFRLLREYGYDVSPDVFEKFKDKNAKLDFNVVQSTLQEDLQEISRWWKQIGLASKLSFSRDRLMECFFWSVGMAFEPQYSDLRKGLTKVTSFITIIDDIYDVYGTLDELELFTAAVESWDIKAVQVLPDYMRICFLALYNTVNELAYHVLYNQGLDILPYLTTAWSDMLKAFLIEAKWSKEKNIPKFEEYLNNAWVSVSGVLILTHAYFLLNPNITKEALHSLQNYHHLLRRPSTIFRLCNDLGTSKVI